MSGKPIHDPKPVRLHAPACSPASPLQSTQHLVLLGGGHAHIEVLRQIGLQRRRQAPAQTQVQFRIQNPIAHAENRIQPLSSRPQEQADAASGAVTADGVENGIRGVSRTLGRKEEPVSAVIAAIAAPAAHATPAAAEAVPAAELVAATDPGSAPHVRVTLVSRGRFTPYSGMLPGWAAGHYSYGECHVDLERLVSYAGAELVTAEATGLDAKARRVLFGDVSPSLPYDVLSVDIGITPGRAAVQGAADAAAVTPVKPIDGFAVRYEQLLERYRAAAAARAAASRDGAAGVAASSGPAAPLLRVVVVGGGPGGVELAAAVRHRLEAERRAGGWPEAAARVDVSLVCRGGLLPGHPPHVRRLLRRLLAERGLRVVAEAAVSVSPGELLLASGVRLPYDECLWCTAASPAAWLRSSGLPTDPQGFLAINEHLQSEGGPPEVFAAGDVASCAAHPRPKAGVYAVRQGPPLTANLLAFLEGRRLERFMPQATALALISLGDRFCVASRTGAPRKAAATATGHGSAATAGRSGGGAASADGVGGGSTSPDGGDGGDGDGPEWPLGWLLNGFGGAAAGLAGPLLWRWKDSIDRVFMRRYAEGLGD